MLNIRLSKDIQKRLTALARKTGRAPSVLAREAIVSRIDGLEDVFLAQARAEKGRAALPLDQVVRLLKLDGPGTPRR